MVTHNKPTTQNGTEFCWLPGAANQRHTSSTSFQSEISLKKTASNIGEDEWKKWHLFTVCESVN